MKDLKIEKPYKGYSFVAKDDIKNNSIRFSDQWECVDMDYEDIDNLIAWLSWLQQEWAQRNMMKDILEQ
jgi:hypothetical protein